MISHLDRRAEVIERTQRHWSEQQAQRGAPQSPAHTITLSREAGCPGTSVAQRIGALLGWQVYDHELLETMAKQTGLPVQALERVDERRESGFLEFLQSLDLRDSVTESGYVYHLVATILEIGRKGRAVVVGRGATYLLPPASTLRVRLTAPKEARVVAAARRRQVSADQARRWVEETDQQRRSFVQRHFMRDPDEPAAYDLILNTARWSVEDCADLVVAALRRLGAVP
ncbi:MAG: cytidylate kinase-like family protein [Gemmataceae bacterium]